MRTRAIPGPRPSEGRLSVHLARAPAAACGDASRAVSARRRPSRERTSPTSPSLSVPLCFTKSRKSERARWRDPSRGRAPPLQAQTRPPLCAPRRGTVAPRSSRPDGRGATRSSAHDSRPAASRAARNLRSLADARGRGREVPESDEMARGGRKPNVGAPARSARETRPSAPLSLRRGFPRSRAGSPSSFDLRSDEATR